MRIASGSVVVFLVAATLPAEDAKVEAPAAFYLSENPRYTIVDSVLDSVRFTLEKTLERCEKGHLVSISTFVDPEAKIMGWHDFGNLEGPGWAANAVGGAFEIYSLGKFLGRKDWQEKALGILDHVLDHGFIDETTGFIKGYRFTSQGLKTTESARQADPFCLNYKHNSDWFCPGSMAKIAFQLLTFAGELGDDARAARMRSIATRCAQWIHEHVPATDNGWFPRRTAPDGTIYKKSPDGGNDSFWQSSADGLFILQLWSRLTQEGLMDYSIPLAERTAAFIRAGGIFGSINHDTYDAHENVAYSVAFRVLLDVSRTLKNESIRSFAYSKCLAGLDQFKMSDDRNNVATKGLLYMEKSWPTAYLWENAEAALAYFEAALDLRPTMADASRRHETDGLTILRAIAKHHHGPHGFLTEGVDWSNHVTQKHHIDGQLYGDIQYTEPFLNNQHIAEPTLFYLKNLAAVSVAGSGPDAGKKEWRDFEGNVLLRFPVAAPAKEARTGIEPRFKVAWSTYLGGNEWEEAREIILQPDGSILVGTQSSSAGLPAGKEALQPKYAGDDPALGHGGVYGGDCYLARLSQEGDKILAATYFGGSRQERNTYGMEVDEEGNIVIATATRSPDAPTTKGSFQPKYGGGPSDMLVAKLSPDMKRLLWCTCIGGSGDDSPRGGLALDGAGNVVVVGTTSSEDFPTTAGAFQTARKGPRDSCVVKLKADGSGLIFGTYLGGTGEDDAIMGALFDRDDNILVAGHTKSADFPGTAGAPQSKLGGGSDAYCAKLSSDASRLMFATYLGGKLDEFAEHRPSLAWGGAMLLAGFTASPDFPTTENALQRSLNGKGDGFLAKLSADGGRFLFSTLLGGSGGENWLMPTQDIKGRIYIVGSTGSRDFPVTPDALQKTYGGGESDGALAILSPDGSRLLYATYLGGSGDEVIRSVALRRHSEIFLVGTTSSTDFPATPGALQPKPGGKGDAFIVKLAPAGYPPGKWMPLFDGESLRGWDVFEDKEFPNMYGKAGVDKGNVILEAGSPMSGISWQGDVPSENYEVSLEAMRVEGSDFFCGMTFPVGDAFLTFIVGGWHGTVVGLSNVDGYSAAENQTTSTMTFEKDRWYRLRLQVTKEKVEAWIDDEKKIDLDRGNHRFAVWLVQEPARPLGITTYYTKAALRDLKIRALP